MIDGTPKSRKSTLCHNISSMYTTNKRNYLFVWKTIWRLFVVWVPCKMNDTPSTGKSALCYYNITTNKKPLHINLSIPPKSNHLKFLWYNWPHQHSALMWPDMSLMSNIVSNFSGLTSHWSKESNIQNVNKHMYKYEKLSWSFLLLHFFSQKILVNPDRKYCQNITWKNCHSTSPYMKWQYTYKE